VRRYVVSIRSSDLELCEPHTAALHVTSLAGGLATAGTAALPAPLAADASNSSADLIVMHDTKGSAAPAGDADCGLRVASPS
jgi:hypothetical protein